MLVIPFAFAGSVLDWEWDRLGFLFSWNLGGFVHFIQFLGAFWMGYLGEDVLTLWSPLPMSRVSLVWSLFTFHFSV
jgi:hypothetical protein